MGLVCVKTDWKVIYVTSNIKLLKTTASVFCALLWITSCHVIGYYLCRRSYREELRLRPIKWEEQRAAGNFVSLEAHPSCSQGLNAWSSSWQLDCHLTRNFKPESWAKFSCIPNCQTVRQWLCVMPKFWNTCYAATEMTKTHYPDSQEYIFFSLYSYCSRWISNYPNSSCQILAY